MPAAPGVSLSAPDFVREEYLKLGARQNLRVLAGVLIAALVVAALVGPRVGYLRAAIWFAAICASQWLRLRVESSVADPAWAALDQRLRRRISIAALCGAAQALVLLAFPLLHFSERAFVTVVLVGLCTGAIANSAGHLRTVAAYVLPMLVPLVLSWSMLPLEGQPGLAGPAMGALLVFYAFLLHGFARAAWRTFEQSCLIRFKDIELNLRLQEALESAQAANRAKTRFLAAASHDLRQPLHTIVLLGSALSLRPLDGRSQEIVALLNEVTEALSAQLDDLLDISKLDAGVVEVNLEAASAAQLVGQHFLEMESQIAAKGLRARLDNRSAGFVRVDPHLLGRVLRNLTHNAIKFTEHGSVTLGTRDEGDDVVLSVRDTGCGIPAEQQEDVFLEFYQASNPERDRSKGLGLGLSIVERLSRLLGIRIDMKSQPGEGTCFELRLPRVAPPALHAPAAGGQVRAADYELHVLIVDDERSVRTSMRLLLEELGCSCTEASSTAQARELARIHPPDLVLADFRLRGDDGGLAALAAVDAITGGVPGVLVSGDTAPDRLREARAAGRRLLHKPLPLDELREELRSAQARRIQRGAGKDDDNKEQRRTEHEPGLESP